MKVEDGPEWKQLELAGRMATLAGRRGLKPFGVAPSRQGQRRLRHQPEGAAAPLADLEDALHCAVRQWKHDSAEASRARTQEDVASSAAMSMNAEEAWAAQLRSEDEPVLSLATPDCASSGYALALHFAAEIFAKAL